MMSLIVVCVQKIGKLLINREGVNSYVLKSVQEKQRATF